MNNAVVLPVRLCNGSTCFVNLPTVVAKLFASAEGFTPLRLSWDEHTAFVSWNGGVSHDSPHALEVPNALAQSLGLAKALESNPALCARLYRIDCIPKAATVYVEPSSPEDWEVIELQAEYLESEFLRQVCVVYTHEVLPVWVHSAVLVHLKVVDLRLAFSWDAHGSGSRTATQTPITFAYMTTSTEVIVSPKIRPDSERVSPSDLLSCLARMRLRVLPTVFRHANTAFGFRETVSMPPRKLLDDDVTCFIHPATLAAASAARECSLPSVMNGEANPKKSLSTSNTADHFLVRVRISEHANGYSSERSSLSNGVIACLKVSSHVRPFCVCLPSPIHKTLGLGNQSYVNLQLLEPSQAPVRPEKIVIQQIRWTSHAAKKPVHSAERSDEEKTANRTFDSNTARRVLKAWRDSHDQRFPIPLCHNSVIRTPSPRPQRQSPSFISKTYDGLEFLVRFSDSRETEGQHMSRSDLQTQDSKAISVNGVDSSEPVLTSAGDSWFGMIPWFKELSVHNPSPRAPSDPEVQRSTQQPTEHGADTARCEQYVLVNNDQVMQSLLLDVKALRPLILVDAHIANKAENAEPGVTVADLAGADTAVEQVLDVLLSAFVPLAVHDRVAFGVDAIPNVLITGAKGSGKTALAESVIRLLKCSAHTCIHSESISCRSLIGKPMQEVLSKIQEAYARAKEYAPSIVLLDNVHDLMPALSEEAGHGNAQADCITEALLHHLRQNRVATALSTDKSQEVLRTLAPLAASVDNIHGREEAEVARMLDCVLETMLEDDAPRSSETSLILGTSETELWGHERLTWSCLRATVVTVATATHKATVHHKLVNSHTGFASVVELETPRARQRYAMMEKIFSRLGCVYSTRRESSGKEGSTSSNFVMDDTIVQRTEGYRPADLDLLCKRAMRIAATRTICRAQAALHRDTLIITEDDVKESLVDFASLSARSARLTSPNVHWSEIGGHEESKQQLYEIFALPTKFRRVYEHVPIKLPSGVLLYGPPGCGKTMLANGAASACGLSLISVKGPELLNKYIGASEQAVRDVFARGAAAAPCMIFFDEFEALAPRRGQDNTGVTDRVVNQLLTFLDGVEGRTAGVYVLAATSRPDLLDVAILRPGRLDRHVYVGPPSKVEMSQIFHASLCGVHAAIDVNDAVDAICSEKCTAGWTGADIKGVVSTAHLSAIQRHLRDASHGDGVTSLSTAEHVTLEAADLLDAAQRTRPSVTADEWQFYARVYHNFLLSSRAAEFPAASAAEEKGKQRATFK